MWTELRFLDQRAVELGVEGFYDWVDLKRFAVQGERSTQRLLPALLSHVRFRDDYLSPSREERPDLDVHGPYRLDAITPVAYEPVGVGTAISTLTAFAGLYGTLDDARTRRATLAREVLPTFEADASCFRLKDLGEAAQHDYGWILDDFTELVVVHARSAILTLIVAAGD